MSPLTEPSRTALGTAYLRAAHQLLDATPRILDDPYAVAILGAGAEARIRHGADRYDIPAARALRSHVVLRARVAEDRLAAAVARGVSQYVILGAGYDTFALRQPSHLQLTRVVEVDIESTQQDKRQRLATAGLALPANTTLGTIDFERTPLRDGLGALGVDLDAKSFFAWLGVTMYLTTDAVADTLAAIARFPAGSEIVLTFAQPTDTPSFFEQRAADVGERWLSAFTLEEMERLLRDCGFAHVSVLGKDDAASYFANRSDNLTVPTRVSIVSATR